jgi:hypothetical protein
MSKGCVIQGLVTIKSGDTIIAEDIENHWVGGGLKGLVCTFLGSHIARNSSNYSYLYGWARQAQMRVGTDNTVTTIASSAITNPIPNTSISGTNIIKNSAGDYTLTISGVWSIGLIPIEINEVGLYLGAAINTTPGWSTMNIDTTWPAALCARISAGDLSFAAFTPPIDQPLTINWTIKVSNNA